jgi:monoamine oxidase
MPGKKGIIIIGGGLSGLTLAYLMAKHSIEVTLLEASPRLGGRIQTINGPLKTPLELGATWFSDLHTKLLTLLEELGLKKYPQFSKGISLFQTDQFEPPQRFSVPEEDSSSYRIAGGTSQLIEVLKERLNHKNLLLSTKVTAIKEVGHELTVETSTGISISTDQVVLCLPPQVIGSTIQFSPALPDPLLQLLPAVQTWMAGSIKFVLEYAEPFWRKDSYSGMVYSNVGIVAEMYDHTNVEETKFGFTGFLNSGASRYSREERKNLVLRQLADLLGEKILSPSTYFDKVWTDDFVLAGNQIIPKHHQNNGHFLLQSSYLNGKLFFGGTETSTEYAGYMEGAIRSAVRVANQILNTMAKP